MFNSTTCTDFFNYYFGSPYQKVVEDDAIVFKFEVPGVEKDKISVEKLSNRLVVVINGVRTIIDIEHCENVSASCKLGILSIRVDKEKGEKIEIK